MSGTVSFSPLSPHNFKLDAAFKQVTPEIINRWSKKAYEEVRAGTLSYFKNCVFQLADLKKIVSVAKNHGTLTFTLVYCQEKTSGKKVANVIAYATQGIDPVLDAVFISGKVNITFNNASSFNVRDKKLNILKKQYGVVLYPPTLNFYKGNGHKLFSDWIKDFELEKAIKAYPDEAIVDGKPRKISTIRVFFDIKTLSDQFKLFSTSTWKEIALVPILLYTGGNEINSSERGDYITYMLFPLDKNGNLQTITVNSGPSTTDSFILTSGCTYPRPWENPSDCKTEVDMLISDFPKRLIS